MGSEAPPTLAVVSEPSEHDSLGETGMLVDSGMRAKRVSPESVGGERPPASVPGGDTEEVDALVVTPAVGELPERLTARAVAPAVQAVAVAAGSFVAGAAAAGLMHRHRHRRDLVRAGARGKLGRGGGRRRNASRTAGELVQIVGSRSLLVDVHLLGGRD